MSWEDAFEIRALRAWVSATRNTFHDETRSSEAYLEIDPGGGGRLVDGKGTGVAVWVDRGDGSEGMVSVLTRAVSRAGGQVPVANDVLAFMPRDAGGYVLDARTGTDRDASGRVIRWTATPLGGAPSGPPKGSDEAVAAIRNYIEQKERLAEAKALKRREPTQSHIDEVNRLQRCVAVAVRRLRAAAR